MASTGICPNTTGCTLGFRKEPIELGKDGRCPECGTPLRASQIGSAGGDRAKIWLIVVVVGLLALLCSIFIVVLLDQTTTSVPTAASVTPSSNAGSPTPILTPSPKPVRTQPHSELDVTERTPERDAVREQVLERIDQMPNVTEEQRSILYAQLQHAKGFGRMATIGFDAGQNELTTEEVEAFEKALQRPQIVKVLSNPSIILVVLGFADAVESLDSGMASSTARAESVANVLRNQAGVLNIIHTVGMGNSKLFGTDPEQNRVTEVWAVLP